MAEPESGSVVSFQPYTRREAGHRCFHALSAVPVPGDEAVLLGMQGSESITAPALSSLAGTIPWHLFTGITPRTARLVVASR